jgi:hypothetical protein
MPISFPASPQLNSKYTYSGKTWTWNGYAWKADATETAVGPAGPAGPAGPMGPAYVPSINIVSTTYSSQASDANKVIQSTGASAYTITITSTLTAGQWIDIVQYGAGQITFVAGAGVTLSSAGARFKTNSQYSMATVICVSSGLYVLAGDLAA